MNTHAFWVTFAFFSLGSCVSAQLQPQRHPLSQSHSQSRPQPRPFSNQQLDWPAILADLRALPKLQKTNYCRKIDHWVLKNHPEAVREFCRITGSLSFDLRYGVGDLQELVDIVLSVPGAKLGLTHSPWNWHLESQPDWGTPPSRCGDPRRWDDVHFEEIQATRAAIVAIKKILDPAGIAVSSMFFDYEGFRRYPDESPRAKEVNTAITTKLNLIGELFRNAWPKAKIVWGSYAAFWVASRPTGWAEHVYYPKAFVPQSGSLEWYHPWDVRGLREAYKKTVANAASYGVREVQVTIPIGSGWPPHTLGSRTWGYEHDYDEAFSWQMGFEVNHPRVPESPDRFAPWDKSPTVMLWPDAWPPQSRHWTKHFIAYAKGAHRIPLKP